MVKKLFYWSALIGLILIVFTTSYYPKAIYLLFIYIPYVLLGIYDIKLSSHNVLRNYPVLGHFRYIFEFIRPEIQQYFVATNQSGRPFNRELRSVIYQRAKHVIDTLPFGTQQDITQVGYEFAYHSLSPQEADESATAIEVGGPECSQPYLASRLNVSAMSFGALGSTAVEALNWGAKLGRFAQNTGEGGLTPYHLKHGGDIIWQLGTGYFGARTKSGKFDPSEFKTKSQLKQVKMIEIKLSQGAKPSHGGILPAAKVDEEIAKLRGVDVGKDCISPPAHTAFDSPIGLLKFVKKLRQLSGGKPVGFKLCIGLRSEFMGICKAMLETRITPDFITIDGAEGGTGAAPLEFSNRLGTPINEAIVFVDQCLTGIDLRDDIRLIASGKVATGFDMVTKIAIGADLCNSARAMMFSIGCIQSLKCNTNQCPTGVATQDPERTGAVIPEEKRYHVRNFHQATLKSFLDLVGAMGHKHPNELQPSDIYHRMQEGVTKSYRQLYPCLQKGELLSDKISPAYVDDWNKASADKF